MDIQKLDRFFEKTRPRVEATGLVIAVILLIILAVAVITGHHHLSQP